MRKLVSSGSLALVALLAACGDSPTRPAAPTPTPTPTPTPVAAATARYRVTFDATWSAATHPQDIPTNPHFSGLIGATHDAATRLWREGAVASDGIKDMAERGRKTPLDTEAQAAIAAGRAQYLLSGEGISRSPGSASLDFEVTTSYRYVTLVSMIAPSPDWFVGVSALDLLEGGDWRGEVTVDLYPWDAGTDSGATYESPDQPTVPREAIARIQRPPLLVAGSVPPVGRFVFRRLP